MIRIKIRTRDTERQIATIQEQLRDLRPLWDIIRREFLVTNIRQIFASDGRGTWLPTSRPNPILRDTRSLFRSYTIPGAPGNINQATPTKLTWGSDIHYAQYHEFGTSRLPVRAVVGLLTGNGQERQLETMVERWVNGLVRRSR